MAVQVLYFAAARAAAGVDAEPIGDPPATVGALRARLAALHPGLAPLLPRCRIAVDQAFAPDEQPIPDGAEVAIVPPVSGGAPRCRVVERPVALAEVVDAVAGDGRGGIVTFTGVVRAESGGRSVLRLEYEAYLAMAERRLDEIATAIQAETGAAVAIVHRVGTLRPGEAAVVIACAAPHRAAAFRACEAAIDRLKVDVPIWKRECFEDGSSREGTGP